MSFSSEEYEYCYRNDLLNEKAANFGNGSFDEVISSIMKKKQYVDPNVIIYGLAAVFGISGSSTILYITLTEQIKRPSSIYLMVLSLDRVLAIVPMKSTKMINMLQNRRKTPGFAIVVCIFIWILSLLVVFPSILATRLERQYAGISWDCVQC
ncbi:Oidioi.mRNA.OKI2018_I69.chr2.g7883.t1.cds [Oikopleura dioica]|uniref:Oidioi.mRNA.OKI2018_I69.chr2.g7883.t1.cds n=1 Tax=Oikopleura dioica TaxID=34765 RepID=A0ABN7T837_OIKDI|nr:Oidioi.mRNA.OKI2018_I69.chr2.g7883.t1.cds [Oikopleura dioica]